MARLEKFLRKAREQPNNLQFNEFQALLLSLGFEFDHQKGSHLVYVHPKLRRPVVIQSRGGKAVAYQVRDILNLVEEYDLLERDNG
jgi:predicted RNA binding protein YcfA (HicA-like mRNA interferase family)